MADRLRPNDSIPYEFGRLAMWVGLVFGALMGMWLFDESGQPGQQYADPWLPCLWMGTLFGGPLYYVELIVRVVRFRG